MKYRVQQAAEYLQVSVPTLHRWRRSGYGPAFYRVGQFCFYDQADLDQFIEAGRNRKVTRPRKAPEPAPAPEGESQITEIWL